MSPPSDILGEYCANILECCKRWGGRERGQNSLDWPSLASVCGMLKMLMKSKSRRESESERKVAAQQAKAEVFYVLSSSFT